MQGVAQQSLPDQADAIFKVPERRPQHAELKGSGRIIGCQLQGATEFHFRTCPVEPDIAQHDALGRVRQREIRIQCECRRSRCTRAGVGLLLLIAIQELPCQHRPGNRQLCLGSSIGGVSPNRPDVVIDPLAQGLFAVSADQKITLQIGAVSIQTATRRAVTLHHRAAPGEKPCLQCTGDGTGDLVLQGKQIPIWPVVTSGPQRGAIRRTHQRGADAHLVTRTPHRALQQVRHAKSVADRLAVILAVAKLECRIATDHFQPAELRQRGNQILGQSIGEELLVLVVTLVGQRQHGNRKHRCTGKLG